MRVIYCDSGFSPREVDYMYQEEYKVAKTQMLRTSFISFEELKRGNLEQATRRVLPADEMELAIYRGWMLKPDQYKQLFDTLYAKNLKLINAPEEYKFCHYLPESYEVIKEYTPTTIFKKLEKGFQIETFQEDLRQFGSKPLVVKDYVKSQKHNWEEACYIPDASNLELVEKVTRNFIDLQGDDLNEGIVYRAFEELEKLTNHSQSGMPLTKEFRLFVLNGEIIAQFNYWDEGEYGEVQPDLAFLGNVIPKIDNHFFTIDIAKKVEGDWIIVELGDGQVAGLPDNANKEEFYSKLKAKLIS